MAIRRNRRRFAVAVALLASAVLLGACGGPGRGLAPPDADVVGIQTVLVFPFANETAEKDLSASVTAGLVRRLGDVGWYDALGPERAREQMSERQLEEMDDDIDAARWHEIARDIALTLDADGYIVGAVLEYGEFVTVGEPYLDEDGDEVQWQADQRTVVTVTVRGLLVNAHTGATVYEKTVTGSGQIAESRPLNWVIPEGPPSDLVPAPHRRDVPAARSKAVEDALDKLTRDILPRPAAATDEDEPGSGPRHP